MAIQNTSDIKPVNIEEEMKKSYLDYAMSVIVSRALPDVRDGLKPVHRRVLYAMKQGGNDSNKPHRKSANVVGRVIGDYHPHGDMAIYDALVRLAQDFSLRVPLIDGQGNFGSLDGDPAAAMRYTECRLAKISNELLDDLDKETVDFKANYDDRLLEPTVLPSKVPNLLVNGTSGIAVGMASNIPSHNLGEVIDAACALVDNPDLTIKDLMQYIPGPDFPTGGIIVGRRGIHDAYHTGRGSVIIRSKTEIEEFKNDRQAIVVTEIPYQVNKARMVERIAELVRDKTIEGISDLRDESNRKGIRVVIEVKKDAHAEVVLNQLYKHTQLQTSFGCNMLALVHGRPEQLNLKDFLTNFNAFREEVIIKRTRFELARAREKAHVLLGFAVAVSNLDPIIELIRKSMDRQDAREQLMARTWEASAIAPMISLIEATPNAEHFAKNYALTEVQANAILDLRLHRLTGMERDKILTDLQNVADQIKEYLDILKSRARVLEILKNELLEVKEKFSTPRRTEIEDGTSDVDIEDLIQKEDMVVTVSQDGYIKRVPLSTYRAQRRGGKGRTGMNTKNEDVVSDIFVANTHSAVLFFTTNGRVFSSKVYKLPLATPQSKGRAIINLLKLEQDEKIATVLVLNEESEKEQFLVFATSFGNVRRNKLEDFSKIRSNGLKAIRLDDGENLIGVKVATAEDDVMLFTKGGICNRFNLDGNIRVFAGRDSNGVRGIKLDSKDEVVSLMILRSVDATPEERSAYIKMANKLSNDGLEDTQIQDDQEDDATTLELSKERFEELMASEQFILTITENGYGKRSSSYGYRTSNRGTQGYKSIVVNQRNGGVVGSFTVTEFDEIMLVTNGGQLIRCPVKDIRVVGRTSQGVIVFRVGSNEKVVSVSHIPGSEEDMMMEVDVIDGEEVVGNDGEVGVDAS
ncbi:MAG: DNA gyrase subunit A [Proteobacteria bacterium]|nr:DNA gyrase subunit A [Pseudomonadota bacterium]